MKHELTVLRRKQHTGVCCCTVRMHCWNQLQLCVNLKYSECVASATVRVLCTVSQHSTACAQQTGGYSVSECSVVNSIAMTVQGTHMQLSKNRADAVCSSPR